MIILSEEEKKLIEEENTRQYKQMDDVYNFMDNKREYWDKVCNNYNDYDNYVCNKNCYYGCLCKIYNAIYKLAKNKYKHWQEEIHYLAERDVDSYNVDELQNDEADVCNLVDVISKYNKDQTN